MPRHCRQILIENVRHRSSTVYLAAFGSQKPKTRRRLPYSPLQLPQQIHQAKRPLKYSAKTHMRGNHPFMVARGRHRLPLRILLSLTMVPYRREKMRFCRRQISGKMRESHHLCHPLSPSTGDTPSSTVYFDLYPAVMRRRMKAPKLQLCRVRPYPAPLAPKAIFQRRLMHLSIFHIPPFHSFQI